MKNAVRILLGAVLLVFLGAGEAWGIPAFARKYGTSCQTCHIAYPKLNQFGETFRLLGYRMPGETEDQVKQPDIPLGAPAYKKVWPKAVWPGGVTESIPVALSANFLVENSSRAADEEEGIPRQQVHNDFRFPDEVAMIAAGIAGDHIAYFGEIAFEQEVEDGETQGQVNVEHMDMRFISPIRGSEAFNVKIGSFQPELVNTFDHARRLTIANYDSMFGVNTLSPGGAASVGGGGHHGGAGLSLPPVARGFEFYGIAAHRLVWNAGFVNGLEPGEDTFDANSRKDYYGRLAYKWGGLAPDGFNAGTYAGNAKNWRESSFRLGLFAYHGNGTDAFTSGETHMGDPVFLEDKTYSRYGADFNWLYRDLNLFGAYVHGRDDVKVFDPDAGDPEQPGDLRPDDSGKFSYDAWFAEADLVLGFPWLHGALRYERVDLPHEMEGISVPDWERATVSLTALIRANVKTTLEYAWDLNESDNYDLWLNFGIVF